ncbi:MAG TPA: family 10 glycosylhydrolase [Gemmataceae bacterium]|nr:family 10 glycosylhydrolase [Gemmataceae bacterium]
MAPRVCTLVALLTALPAWAADPPEMRREFRGVWVATVANIDWPSKPGLPARQQQDELRAIFDKCVALKLNAVVLQIRPMCDALYKSDLEPWSEYLTGTLGKDPGYDPLAFAVQEAHDRGLELHAWFNPYRAHSPSARSPIPDTHIVKKRPDLAKPYGKHHWLNPTNPAVADLTLKVVLDVVRRYDIDGVHMDDYFYPYAEKDDEGKTIPFPDDDTWAAYQKSGGKLSRSDWRRAAVDDFVERLYRDVKKEKKWVKVGISPFGIWRPGHPPGIEGFDQYEGLYADAKKWFNEGWVDYFTPQLYWPIKQEKQSYPKLLGWWAGENTQKRHLWPGNIPSRVTRKDKGWAPSEIADQIDATRAQAGATGNIHFSMKPLMNNVGGVSDVLAKVYAEPALVPASPWLDNILMAKPQAEWTATRKELRLVPRGEEPTWLFAVRLQFGGKWETRIYPAAGRKDVRVAYAEAPDRLVVTAVDRNGNESPAAVIGK